MKAEDLLQAMNDIDTKYVAEAQPWTAPVKKLHHPVWAAAAAVMLCLGLGAGAAVMLHSPAVQPGAEGGVTTELSSSQEAGGAISELDVNLEFAQLTPEEYSEKFITFLNEYQEVAVAPGQPGVRRHLRRRAPDWGGNSGNLGGALPWDENIYTEATAHYAQDGTLVEVEVNGYTGEVEEVASEPGGGKLRPGRCHGALPAVLCDFDPPVPHRRLGRGPGGHPGRGQQPGGRRAGSRRHHHPDAGVRAGG